MGRTQLAGLMVDKKEVKTGTIDQMDRGEVEARLRNLIEKHELVRTETIEIQAEEIEELEEDGEVEVEIGEVEEAEYEDIEDEDIEDSDLPVDEGWEDDEDEDGDEGITPSTPPA